MHACLHCVLGHEYDSRQCHGRTRAIVVDNNDMAGQDRPRGNDLCGVGKLYKQGTYATDKVDLRSAFEVDSRQAAAPWFKGLAPWLVLAAKVMYVAGNLV